MDIFILDIVNICWDLLLIVSDIIQLNGLKEQFINWLGIKGFC